MAGFTNPLIQGGPQDPNKSNAIRRLVMGPNGPQVQLVDAITGQPISDASQYNVIDSQAADLKSLGLLPTENKEESNKTNTSTNKDTSLAVPEDTYKTPGFNTGASDTNSSPSGSGKREVDNNYGYIDKPGFVGALSALPGVAGMVAKGVNAGINANNVGAVNAARQDMGIDKLGFGQTVSGIARDRSGFVANVDYTDQYGVTAGMPVSLEPVQNQSLSPDMITGLPGSVALSSKQQPNAYTEDTSKSKSGTIRGFLENLFSPKETEDTKTVSTKAFGDISVASPKSGGVYDQFPDAPTAPSSNHAQERERDTSLGGDRGGLSDAARDAVDKGPGGLY